MRWGPSRWGRSACTDVPCKGKIGPRVKIRQKSGKTSQNLAFQKNPGKVQNEWKNVFSPKSGDFLRKSGKIAPPPFAPTPFPSPLMWAVVELLIGGGAGMGTSSQWVEGLSIRVPTALGGHVDALCASDPIRPTSVPVCLLAICLLPLPGLQQVPNHLDVA